MSVRSTALAASVVALALVFISAAPGKRPPPPPPSDQSPPTTPSGLRITATGPTSISLAWNASSDNSGNFWYVVQGCGGSIRVNPPQTTFTNTRLSPDRTYSCFVYALDAAGNRSGNSNTVSYTTPPDATPPTAPTLTATTVWPTRVSLSWTESVDNVSQVYYTLLVDGSPYGADQIGYRADTVLHLSPSTTYVFRVTVRDSFGNTAQSNVLSVTTPAVTDTVPPTAPANLSLSSESSPPEAWLDWDQSTDNTDPQSQILYEVYVNGELATESTVIGYGSTIAYCRAEGTNTIMVKATDTSGNVSAPSNEILFPC
jgi:chitodextrinase